MCGFLGVASTLPVLQREWLSLGSDAILHRGPDGSGEWWSDDGQIGLLHRRLAIFDLTNAGHQPMHHPESQVSIVYNGEIYNHDYLRTELEKKGHCFRSQSDTEVLLVAYVEWGHDCLSRINGMFSFVILDSRKKEIFLARDRAGEKPLFFYSADGCIYFASELKALFKNNELPRTIDVDSLEYYLAMGFVPGEHCILKGYKKLPPASALTFSLTSGEIKQWRYWELPEYLLGSDNKRIDESDLLEELETLLDESVSMQLEADVPVGILLSGGVDSSLVTALAVRHSSKVKTFSIGFPGHGKLDETLHARLIANHFGTEHLELMAEPSTADLIPLLAKQYDEPMADSSMIPTYMVSKLVREHCTVALGGDGGDELFGGYSHYSRLIWLQENIKYFPKIIRSVAASGADRFFPVGMKGRNWLQGLDADFINGLPNIGMLFDATTRRNLILGTEVIKSNESLLSERVPVHSGLLQRATRMDFYNYLPDDILVKVDRSSMMNSLELRSPLLDYRIIEFAFGKVPSNLKATNNNKKILLKTLAKRLLPEEFDYNRKQGFSIPLEKWLKSGPFRELFWDTLTSNNILFDTNTVNSLLLGQDKGRNNGERLFSLLLLELWRHEYGCDL